MKIVMLGHTGVGKTTYMASLYDSMQRRVEGFHLKTVDAQDHPRLMSLAAMIQRGTYPPPTAHRDEYGFSLRYQGKELLEFLWADYKGGAITQKKQASGQAALLEEDLKEVDGIMMFCDCDALARGNLRGIQLGRMTALVARAIRNLDRPIALSIVLTKSDQILKFEEDTLAPFNGLLSAISASEWVRGSFIPISCGVGSINIPMPLLFTLHTAVLLQLVVASYKLEEHSKQADVWQKKSQGFSGFVRLIDDVWNGVPTDKQMAESSMKKALEAYQQLEYIKEPVEALTKYIDKLPIISQENDIRFYVKELSRIKSGMGFPQSNENLFHNTNVDPFEVFK